MKDEHYKIIVTAARDLGAKFPTTAHWLKLKAAIDQAVAAHQLTANVLVVSETPVHVPQAEKYDGVIGMIDAKLLKIACPENTLEKLEEWVEPTKAACKRWGIDTIREVASFLANIGNESGGLKRLEENMNYSAKRMAEVWPGRFAKNPSATQKHRQPNMLAISLAHNPERLANHVYANRMGNGPPESGDGYRYRGYGPKQLTGKNNHARFAKAIGIPVEEVPAYLQTKNGGMQSAGWFWFDNGMDALAATPGISDDRKKINGGLIGVEDVENRFNNLIAELLLREKQK